MQYGKSDRLKAKTIAKRTSKGCFDFTSKSYKIENVVYDSCIGNFTTNINYFIESLGKYELGLMPFDGSLGEQPNRIIEVFNVIDYRKNFKREQLEKQRK